MEAPNTESVAEEPAETETGTKKPSIPATKRVLAPYMELKKVYKHTSGAEHQFFNFYVTQKPSILTEDLSDLLNDRVDLKMILNETVDILVKLTHASGAFLYMVDESCNMLYLVSDEPPMNNHIVSWPIMEGTTLAAFVAFNKTYEVVNDVLNDIRFPLGIGNEDLMIQSVMCIPIVTPREECQAVIELYRFAGKCKFIKSDLRLCLMMSGWISSAIYQNKVRINLQKQQELNDYLLKVTQCYLSNIQLLSSYLTDIVSFAKRVLNAEYSSFYVIREHHGELLADLYEEGVYDPENNLLLKSIPVNITNDDSIPSCVAKDGLPRNLKSESQLKPLFQTRHIIAQSMLCMPIKGTAETLGVISFINKADGGRFTAADEKLCEVFCTYCSFALNFNKLHRKKTYYKCKNHVYEEILSHQMKPCIHDITNMVTNANLLGLPQNFNQFDWYMGEDNVQFTPHLIMYMIQKLLPNNKILHGTLMEFVLTVKKAYRTLAYHNFEHAFTFTHTMYNIIRRNRDRFTDLEIQALMIAGLCHDIDHRGLTNNFMALIMHPLRELYEESTMENHHYQITKFILQDLGMYKDLTPAQHKEFMRDIREAILSTDLSVYFKRRAKLYAIVQSNEFDWANPEHKMLVKSIMMTTCDLAGMCKPFSIARMVTNNLYKEFYEEGDVEKKMLLCPLSVMDRQQQNMVSSDQVQFLTVVVMPCTQLLAMLLPNCIALYQGCFTLRNTWQEIYDSMGTKVWNRENTYVQRR